MATIKYTAPPAWFVPCMLYAGATKPGEIAEPPNGLHWKDLANVPQVPGPFIVRWTGKLPAGEVYQQPVIQLDILPTALDAAGVKLAKEDAIDGVSLLPHLRGENKDAPHDKLFWRFGAQTAIRAGDWKLVKANNSDGVVLVNLKDDIGESKVLSAEHPAKRKEL